MKGAIAFSLWGDQTKYTLGLLENIELAKVIYPSWDVIVFIERGHYLIPRIRVPHVIVQEMDPVPGSGGMFWRFLAADWSQYSHVIVRDADSRLNPRERLCVHEWIRSDKTLHVMRDHEAHYQHAVIGGAWGIKTNALDMRYLISQWPQNYQYGDDEAFLENVIWPQFYPHSFLRHSKHLGSLDDTAIPDSSGYKGFVCEPRTPETDVLETSTRCVVLSPRKYVKRRERFLESCHRHASMIARRLEVYVATDVSECVVPSHYSHHDTYPHYFAASRDHVRILERALLDGVETLLVFEDDAAFCQDFEEYFARMWLSCPTDAMGGMLGGQHQTDHQRQYTAWPLALAQVKGCLGMHGVWYRRRGMERAYDHFTYWHRETIDQAFVGLQKEDPHWYAPAKWVVEIDPAARQFGRDE